MELQYEVPGQDGYGYRAVRVDVLDQDRHPGDSAWRGHDGGADRRAIGGWFAYAPRSGEPSGFPVEVDGEVFLVSRSESRGTHLNWITGPNLQYGFSTSLTFGPNDAPRLAGAIRDFLAGINPGTGYRD